MNESSPERKLTKRSLVIRCTWVVVCAVTVAILFVLPAEYGIDPTGFGKATGLVEMADEAMSPEQARGALREGVFTPAAVKLDLEPGRGDHWRIELAPYESIEFKYELAEGKAMAFRWRATDAVHFDMHAHPFEGGAALTESYEIGDSVEQRGRYVAPFTGIHGWYWQNRSMKRVLLTLDAKGGIVRSRIFDKAGEQVRPLFSGAGSAID